MNSNNFFKKVAQKSNPYSSKVYTMYSNLLLDTIESGYRVIKSILYFFPINWMVFDLFEPF